MSLQSVDDVLVPIGKGSEFHVEERGLSEALLDVCLVGLDLHEALPDLSLERHEVLDLGVQLDLFGEKSGDRVTER